MHLLEREIILHAEPAQVWRFMATPANLDELTPPELRFRILSEIPERMYDGLLILYELKIPRFGSRRWLTEIKHIREGESFVDEQRLGPYRFWYHQHQLEEYAGDKTLMRDRVHYQLPFGILGTLVHALRVRAMLAEIFAYRAQRLKELFNG